jgi:hypothetical protein
MVFSLVPSSFSHLSVSLLLRQDPRSSRLLLLHLLQATQHLSLLLLHLWRLHSPQPKTPPASLPPPPPSVPAAPIPATLALLERRPVLSFPMPPQPLRLLDQIKNLSPLSSEGSRQCTEPTGEGARCLSLSSPPLNLLPLSSLLLPP